MNKNTLEYSKDKKISNITSLYQTLNIRKNLGTKFILKAWVFCLLIVCSIGAAPALINLEEMAQDFVQETKRINIKGFPDAFNPSIIIWENSILMCFRFRDPLTSATDGIGFIWLDDQLEPKGSPKILRYQHDTPNSKPQDPRLVSINHNLYMVYSNLIKVNENEVRRVFLAQLHYDGVDFYAYTPTPVVNFNSNIVKPIEKNWVPFEYNSNLMLAYSILPHRIFLASTENGYCKTVALTKSDIQWNWGELRGGTMALKLGNEYLSFFHSSKEMFSAHSNGKKISHYFMGAYTFSSSPPFAITRISPQPIIGKNFYDGPMYQTWKPLRVVFPGGFIYDEKYIWITYGKQDHEIWIARLDKTGLFNSLIKVTTKD